MSFIRQTLSTLPILLIFGAGCCLACMTTTPYDICDEETESYGPIAPGVPEVFTLWASVTDKLKNVTVWMKETYDGINKRAKLELTEGGVTEYIVYDYLKRRVLTYISFHPNAVNPEGDVLSQTLCASHDIETAPQNISFLGPRSFGSYINGKVRMYDQYQVLQFGGNYKFAYMPDYYALPQRGIPVKGYRGCVSNKYENSTYSVNFFWADDNIFSDTFQSGIAVRKELAGGFYRPDSQWVPQEEVHDIIYFNREPVIQDEEFQVPPSTFCTFGNKDEIKMPKFPVAFTYRMEMLSTIKNIEGQQAAPENVNNYMAWYDHDLQIARFDYKPGLTSAFDIDPIIDIFQDATPVSAVFDFNSGISYYTHKATGQCLVADIPADSFFVSKNLVDGKYVKLATPEEIFDTKGITFKYKGKYINRGLKCDVWTSTYQVKDRNVTRDLYFTTEDAHIQDEDRNTYRALVRDTQRSFSYESKILQEKVVVSNIFRFKAEAPKLSDFDVEHCLSEGLPQGHFKLTFTFDKDDRDYIMKHQNQFTQNARMAIFNASKIGSPLRVQKLQIEFMHDVPEVKTLFILLEKRDTGNAAVSKPEQKLNVVHATLNKAVDAGQLEVLITSKFHQNPARLVAKKGSLERFVPLQTGSLSNSRKKRDAITLADLLIRRVDDAAIENADGVFDIDEQEPSFDNRDGASNDDDSEEVNRDGVSDEDDSEDVSKDGGDDDDVNKDGEDDGDDNSDLNKETKKPTSGMTKGGLIGLAFGILIIGIIVGVGVMWLLLKRPSFGKREDENTIVMSDSVST